LKKWTTFSSLQKKLLASEVIRMSLTDYVSKTRKLSFGISISDIAQLELSESLIEDIKKGLKSTEFFEVKMALFFLEGLLSKKKGQDEFILKNIAIEFLPRFLVHSDHRLRTSAYSILSLLGNDYPGFRREMVAALNNEDPLVRQSALNSFRNFGDKSDIKLLLHFEHDLYTSEIGMGSHLVYLLRNLALEVIEELLGKSFPKKELKEQQGNGNVVFWWDWKPFHKLRLEIV
jgi:HEAT repeat protein